MPIQDTTESEPARSLFPSNGRSATPTISTQLLVTNDPVAHQTDSIRENDAGLRLVDVDDGTSQVYLPTFEEIEQLISLNEAERGNMQTSSNLTEIEGKLVNYIRDIFWQNEDGIRAALHDERLHRIFMYFNSIMPEGNYILNALVSDFYFRRQVESSLQPDRFFGHGGFFVNFPKILDAGGVMSTVGRLNKGYLSRSDRIPRWENPDNKHPHAEGIFFFPWSLDGPLAGAYTASRSEEGRRTDMAIFFRTQDIATHANSMVVISEGLPQAKSLLDEVAFTNSQATSHAAELVRDNTDDLVLPIQEAYLVIDDYKRPELLKMVADYGLSEEWVNEHVLFLDGMHGNSRAIMELNRDYIDAWLKSREDSKAPPARVKRVRVHNGRNPYYGNVFVFQKSYAREDRVRKKLPKSKFHSMQQRRFQNLDEQEVYY